MRRVNVKCVHTQYTQYIRTVHTVHAVHTVHTLHTVHAYVCMYMFIILYVYIRTCAVHVCEVYMIDPVLLLVVLLLSKRYRDTEGGQ